ncbi:MAG: glycerol kinase [Elusimicrobia bacterium]|nr:glycerol kinase [Elusimicrobiota bacterium]
MGRDVVLALDQGSSSSRALAVDASGRVRARCQRPIKTWFPREGWVEHDAADIARTQERALDGALARLARSDRVLGLGIAAQRSTVVFWDRRTGSPACRAPSWQDGRASAVVSPLLGRQAEVHDKTGLYLTPYYSAPKIKWALENVDAVRGLADAGRLCVGPVSTYLIWRLTGGEVFVADPTMAQRTLLLNTRTMDWDEGMLAMFGIPRGVLPRVAHSAGSLGTVRRAGRTIPILAALGDQQAAAVGLGAMEEGSSVVNYGTGAFFLHHTGAGQHRIPGLLTSVGWSFEGGSPVFFLEGTVHAVGTTFDWLRESIGLFGRRSDVERLCAKSANRVLALPALGGLGAPRWDFGMRAAFSGLTARTRKEDLVRGMAEGVAFLIADIVGTMRAAGVNPGRVKASGGLSRLDHLVRFQADILGLTIDRCLEREATAMGAASLAAQACGAPWAPALRTPVVQKTFEPAMAKDKADRLLAVWRRFVEAQGTLSRELAALPS